MKWLWVDFVYSIQIFLSYRMKLIIYLIALSYDCVKYTYYNLNYVLGESVIQKVDLIQNLRALFGLKLSFPYHIQKISSDTY